jgi:mRNA-degrading endonuclease toxin of MazEF toxin-antitoxin module
MPPQIPANVRQGDIYWCDPDPEGTIPVGSEQVGERPWVIISHQRVHRGNCVVGMPLSRHIGKSIAHLVAIPKGEITMEDGTAAIDRVALTDQVRPLDKLRLKQPRAGYVSIRAINCIVLGLDYLFGKAPLPKSN